MVPTVHGKADANAAFLPTRQRRRMTPDAHHHPNHSRTKYSIDHRILSSARLWCGNVERSTRAG
jgi:hypothetical protein